MMNVADAGEVRVANSASGETAGKRPTQMRVALLTGGDDRPYAIGMALALAEQGIVLDFIGSDKLEAVELRRCPRINFLNLRGDQNEEVAVRQKASRIALYYFRLLTYAIRAEPKVFHILWNNRFELFDRTILMLYYRLLRRRIVFTAHNINKQKRDGHDTWLNRVSLRIQYRLCHHILVHTDAMRAELINDFQVPPAKVSVIPFGINDTTPTTDMSGPEARQRLGLTDRARVLLFFGQIAPYKGLEYLIAAASLLFQRGEDFVIVVAGKVKRGAEAYWANIERMIAGSPLETRVVAKIEFIPDSEVELYFKAADAVVLPYTDIFQSGVPFLSYSFGVPVIATDVGSLRDDIVEGETGFVCRPADPAALARAIGNFFESAMFHEGAIRRSQIRDWAMKRHSWTTTGEIVAGVYGRLLAPLR